MTNNTKNADTKRKVPTVPKEPTVPKGPSMEREHNMEKELHAHDHGTQNLEQNHLAEQQRKTQQQEQNNREVFPKGLAQEHGKGHG